MVVEAVTKVAIIGANGQLGTDLVEAFGNSAIPLKHSDIDVCKPSTFSILKKEKPDIIINTASYVKVKEAEVETEEALKINAVGALNIAKLSKEINATNVYISTDYVFDGTKKTPYTEDDSPNPINVYGLSKYAGELFTKNYCNKYYIIRVASLFGKAGSSGKGGNFIETMINKANNKETIKVVNDILISPTYTKDVAENLKKFLSMKPKFGVYHFANSGYCSWYDMTKEIFKILKINITLMPISSNEFSDTVNRPKFSVLKNKKLEKLGIKMPDWKVALKNYLIEKRLCTI